MGQVALLLLGLGAWLSLGHPTAVFGFGLGPSPNTKPVHTIDGGMDIQWAMKMKSYQHCIVHIGSARWVVFSSISNRFRFCHHRPAYTGHQTFKLCYHFNESDVVLSV